jgi:hypothetical protein
MQHIFNYKSITRNVRDNRTGNQEWTNQRHLKGQSRMDKPETPEGAIKNGQTRDTLRGNQEWTNQRHLKGQSRMDKPETPERAIKNGQTRDT